MTTTEPPTRHPTGFAPLDALLRGGLPRGGVAMLVGGVGVGKSTLFAQCAAGALYVGCDEVSSTVATRVALVGGRFDAARFRSAATLTEALRAVASTDLPCVLVDGAQELGRTVFTVVHALREAARVANVAVLVAFERAAPVPEAEHAADVALRLTRDPPPSHDHRLALTKYRAAPSAVIALRLTRAGFVAAGAA